MAAHHGRGGYSVSISDRAGKEVPGRDAPPALLWDPKGKRWAYVLLPNKMGRNAEFLPDGCALSWTPLTMFNPDTGKVSSLPDPGIDMLSWEGSMVVLRDGMVIIAGMPDTNNNGFFHRKASCNGFAVSPGDAALIPSTRYEKETPTVSRPAVFAKTDKSIGWQQKTISIFMEYRWIILALVVPFVLYIVIRFGLMPLFSRIGQVLPENTRQRLNRPVHRSYSLVTRVVVYGIALMVALPMLWTHFVFSSINNTDQCAFNAAQCLDKETHLLPSVPALERGAYGNKVKPTIPCRYVGIWSSRRGPIMFRIELKDDGTYAMAPNEYGVGDPHGYTGYWMVQGEYMVWRHNQAYTIEPDINPIITESDTRFQLIEVNGKHTQYELIKSVESTHCTP